MPGKRTRRPLREVALGVINALFLLWIVTPARMLVTGGASFFALGVLFAAVLGTPPALAVAGIVLRGKRRRRALLLPSAVLWLLAGSASLVFACSPCRSSRSRSRSSASASRPSPCARMSCS